MQSQIEGNNKLKSVNCTMRFPMLMLLLEDSSFIQRPITEVTHFRNCHTPTYTHLIMEYVGLTF